jgi:Fe-S cluster biogenesis protein NfuA/nitrite reductase/ring-hydroxylating ferredoxin subunit
MSENPHRTRDADHDPSRRVDLARLLHDLERLEQIFATWDEGSRGAVEAYRRALDALNGESLLRLIRELKRDPAAFAAMKRAAADEVVYAVLRHHNLIKPSLNERIESALASVRPMLASHGGDVRLVSVEPPAVEVELMGACDGCAASALTFRAGIAKAVQNACPEISEVIQAKGRAGSAARFVSPFALDAQGGWFDAGGMDAVPDGGAIAMDIDDEPVLLFRSGAVVTCFRNACAHLGSPLDAGSVERGVLTCPRHGFRYDLSSGECLTALGVRLHAHAVRTIGNRVEIRLAT